MANDRKWLLWPDTHIPYHNKRHVNLMLKIVKAWKPDRLTFLGDLDDMKAPSRFADGTPDEWKDRLLVTTRTDTYDFLVDIRKMLPEAEIDYFEGNHEARLTSYIAKNAPALDGLVTVPKILDLDNLGINWYPYMDVPTKLEAGYHVYHGSTVRGESGASAKGEAEKFGVSGFSGHTHRLSNYHKTYLDREIEWYECGHLMDLKKAEYDQHFNWQSGFVYAHVSGNHVWPVEAPIRANKVFVDGRLFK